MARILGKNYDGGKEIFAGMQWDKDTDKFLAVSCGYKRLSSCLEATCPLSNFIRRISSFWLAPLKSNHLSKYWTQAVIIIH